MTKILVGGVFSGVSIKSIGTGLTVQNINTGLMNFSVNSQTNLVTVSGALNISGTLNTTSISMDEIYIGTGAGANVISSNSSNIFIGVDAGANVTSGENILIGSNAGKNVSQFGNIAIGEGALSVGIAVGFSSPNICIGVRSGINLIFGGNVIIGDQTALAATESSNNVIIGGTAGIRLTVGDNNTLVGAITGRNITTGTGNVCLGFRAGDTVNTGNQNICLGLDAGNNVTTSSDNIAIGSLGVNVDGTINIGTAGTHNTCFIAGIRGVTTGVADAIPVLIDSNGQLGIVSSSERYKCDINKLKIKDAKKILNLNPVSFKYKKNVENGNTKNQYGLIAEQVHEHMPEIIIYDKNNKPETIAYYQLHAHYISIIQLMWEKIEKLELKN